MTMNVALIWSYFGKEDEDEFALMRMLAFDGLNWIMLESPQRFEAMCRKVSTNINGGLIDSDIGQKTRRTFGLCLHSCDAI